jgi:hypothetical protein
MAGIRTCPCCGRLPRIVETKLVSIACPTGCIIKQAENMEDAIKLWNEPRFTDKT